MPLTIQPVAGATAIQRTSLLAWRIWREYYPGLVGSAQVEYMLRKFQSKKAIAGQIRKGALYFVIKDPQGRWAGYLAAEPRPGELFLSKFYVAAEKRGRGLGRRAMRFVVKLARKIKAPKIVLSVNRKNHLAVRFYERAGFKVKKRINQDIGRNFFMRDYVMEKRVVKVI